LAERFSMVTGDQLESKEPVQVAENPKWTVNDSPAVAHARHQLFGDNPLRKLSPKEVGFNLLAGLVWQKFDSMGRPLLDQHEMSILYE
jgi:hypothetical protein